MSCLKMMGQRKGGFYCCAEMRGVFQCNGLNDKCLGRTGKWLGRMVKPLIKFMSGIDGSHCGSGAAEGTFAGIKNSRHDLVFVFIDRFAGFAFIHARRDRGGYRSGLVSVQVERGCRCLGIAGWKRVALVLSNPLFRKRMVPYKNKIPWNAPRKRTPQTRKKIIPPADLDTDKKMPGDCPM